jgi:MFS family permease
MIDIVAPCRPWAFVAVAARALLRRGIHYGWLMIALAFLFAMGSASAMSIAVALLKPVPDDLAWPIAVLSGGLALRTVSFGLIAPFAGRLLRSYGSRRMLAGSAILMIASCFLAVTMSGQWQKWLALGVAMMIGSGMTMLGLATITTWWFPDRPGLVLGVLVAGSAAGQMIVLMSGAWLAETDGWLGSLLWP